LLTQNKRGEENMIGLLILVIGVGYYYLSKFIIKNTYEKYGAKKAKYIAIAIMVLIPTWDIVLGYPIYAFLCLSNSGVKIYQSIDNVEGFYVGELDPNYPYPPYKGYRYMDYKGEKSDKYYRNYWMDNNTSELCIPVGKHTYGDYAKAFKQGRCVAREEIHESEISHWEYKGGIETKAFIPFLGISKSVSEKIIDRTNGEVLSKIIEYPWNQGWLINSINHIIPLKVFYCKHKIALNEGYINTLKPNKGEN